METGINYSELVDASLRQVLRGALEQVADAGAMPEGHLFYITFVTDFPGLKIPKYLQKQYPEKMTIVLQHQFENLAVTEEGFKVALSFSGINEKLNIPFAAVIEFADPHVNFALQFQSLAPDNDAGNDLEPYEVISSDALPPSPDSETIRPLSRKKGGKSKQDIAMDSSEKEEASPKSTASKQHQEDKPRNHHDDDRDNGDETQIGQTDESANNVVALDAYRRS